MSERRSGDATLETAPEGKERRMGDRRDSHRLPVEVEVRQGNDDYQSHKGNLAIGGVFFDKQINLPIGTEVQLRFIPPGNKKQIEVKGQVVEITQVGKPKDQGTRVRFLDLDIKTELTIARCLDDNPT